MQNVHVLDGGALKHSPQRAQVDATAQSSRGKVSGSVGGLGPVHVDTRLCMFMQLKTWLCSAGKPCC